MYNKNGEPDAVKAASPVRRGVHVPTIHKVGWPVPTLLLAALLWSFALSEINKPEYDVDFLTAIILNLMLAFSVLLTPMIVSSLLKGGLAGQGSFMGSAVLGAAALTPTSILGKIKSGGSKVTSGFKDRSSSRDEEAEVERK